MAKEGPVTNIGHKTKSYMGPGLRYRSLIDPEQPDKRQEDIKSFPERSINTNRGSSVKFNSGPAGNMIHDQANKPV